MPCLYRCDIRGVCQSRKTIRFSGLSSNSNCLSRSYPSLFFALMVWWRALIGRRDNAKAGSNKRRRWTSRNMLIQPPQKNIKKQIVSGKMKGFYTTWKGLSWIKRLDGFMLFTWTPLKTINANISEDLLVDDLSPSQCRLNGQPKEKPHDVWMNFIRWSEKTWHL